MNELLGPRARSAARGARRRARRAVGVGWLALLNLSNRFSRASVLGSAEAVVSLTTYGQRVETVASTIESIARGRCRPRRMVLWLDDERAMAGRPAALRRLERRGLEIRLAENFGPHTKYYPYVASERAHALPLVTADDDMLYPRSWLASLVRAHHEDPDMVVCLRASVVGVRGERLLPYDDWPRCTDRTASIARFATGVSGVLYPVAMLDELARLGTAFRDVTPKADDLWLHWVAVRTGTSVRQASVRPRQMTVVPGTQEGALQDVNVRDGGNDRVIEALYSAEDVSRIAAAPGVHRASDPDEGAST